MGAQHYTLTFGGLLLLGGRADDILGRRRVLMAGILLFTFASLLGGFAQEPWHLLAARALQGVGGAIGLLAGGMLTEWPDWRWVLFVNVPSGKAEAAGPVA